MSPPCLCSGESGAVMFGLPEATTSLGIRIYESALRYFAQTYITLRRNNSVGINLYSHRALNKAHAQY
jgi:hypothetical protein